jgi:hypothetical protein
VLLLLVWLHVSLLAALSERGVGVVTDKLVVRHLLGRNLALRAVRHGARRALARGLRCGQLAEGGRRA